MKTLGLSKEQLDACEALLSERHSGTYTTLGGYAGTGKTTIIKHLIEQIPESGVATFTGKASDVLRRKGVPSSTIHSLIYRLVKDDKGKPIRDEYGNLQWEKIPCPYSVLFIDEASMVPEWIHQDLTSMATKLYYIGDHGQLPPVGDDFNLMQDPHYRLETIHRNAGPISKFANYLREGGNPRKYESNESIRIGQFEPSEAGQIICGFNRTRHSLNKYIRRNLSPPRSLTQLEEGDQIIILQNDHKLGIFNGMQCVVEGLGNKNKITVTTNTGHTKTFSYNPRQIEKRGHYTIAIGWSYCITCHKAQGDEYDTIGVYDEQCELWEPARWRYTAASRAKNLIYWDPS